MKRIRVALICHFSNPEVRKELPISKLIFRNWIRRYLEKQPINVKQDFAPWVTNLIKEFEKMKDVEVHVIAPHTGLTCLTCEFSNNGVNYHFFKSDLFYLYDIARSRLPLLGHPKYRMNRFFVKRFFKRIKPDIVDLIGSENPYYSITAMDIKDVPIYVSVQTVYTNPARQTHSGECDPFRWDTELEIHKKVSYYGSAGRMHRDLIIKNNPDAVVFKANFCKQQPVIGCNVPEIKYDFVFFAANITVGKGIEDAIQALAIVKKLKNGVCLNVVGNCTPKYKAELEKLIDELNLIENVIFNDYFPLQSDMFKQIKHSSFAILPIKLDVIPGTIIESMFLEIPLVTYKTSGTPYLNKDEPCVLLAEMGDINELANQMIKLLESPMLAETLKSNAKAFAVNEYDSMECALRIVRNYRAVIEHYHHQTPIPRELLFDINEFPLY